MRSVLWGALLAVVILVGVAPSAYAADEICADNKPCAPYGSDETDSQTTTWGTGGQNITCRSVWGKPETYCFIETWVWNEQKKAWVEGPCSRGYTNSGWCTCEVETGKLGGSCSFR